MCNGETELNEGDSTSLTCEVSYGGSVYPSAVWMRGSTEKLVGTTDDDIGRVLQQVTVVAAAVDDGVNFTCLVTFGDISSACVRTLSVKCKIWLTPFVWNVNFSRPFYTH